MNTVSKDRYKLSAQELYGAIDQSDKLIKSYCKTCSQEQLSALYLARASMRVFRLEYKVDSADGDFKPNPREISGIKNDFLKTQANCKSCKCGMFDDMVEFYNVYGTQSQLDSLKNEAKAMGKPADHTYIGVDLGYIQQKGVFSAGIGIVTASTVRQPKKFTDGSGRRYRQCKYDYPSATGFAFIGYETAFGVKGYSGFRLDPVWFNHYISVHPAQLVFAKGQGQQSIIYRPELGFSFSTFAIDYAMNIPVKDFNLLPLHNLSIRFTIPAIRLR